MHLSTKSLANSYLVVHQHREDMTEWPIAIVPKKRTFYLVYHPYYIPERDHEKIDLIRTVNNIIKVQYKSGSGRHPISYAFMPRACARRSASEGGISTSGHSERFVSTTNPSAKTGLILNMLQILWHSARYGQRRLLLNTKDGVNDMMWELGSIIN